MNEIDIKVLDFREELIKLCKEYNCELSSSCRDDGTMNLEFHNKKNGYVSQYIMEDESENYNLYQEDNDYNRTYIADLYIKNHFNRESSEMSGLNNIKVYCGIITNDSGKAEGKIREIFNKFDKKEVKEFRLSRDSKELRLNNGQRYLWVKPDECSRGYRFGSVIIDRNISLENFHDIISPICYACGRNDVEIF